MKKRKTQHERDCEAMMVSFGASVRWTSKNKRFVGTPTTTQIFIESNAALARILNRALAAHRKGKRDGK